MEFRADYVREFMSHDGGRRPLTWPARETAAHAPFCCTLNNSEAVECNAHLCWDIKQLQHKWAKIQIDQKSTAVKKRHKPAVTASHDEPRLLTDPIFYSCFPPCDLFTLKSSGWFIQAVLQGHLLLLWSSLAIKK